MGGRGRGWTCKQAAKPRPPSKAHTLDEGAALEGGELVLADAPVPVRIDELEQPAHLVLQILVY